MRPATRLLVLCCTVGSLAQSTIEIPLSYYEGKVKKYHSMNVGGILLSAGGVIFTIAGTVMMAGTQSTGYQVTYHPDGTQTEEGSPVGGLGAIMVSTGIPMIAGGIVLNVVGSRKEKEAREKLEKRRLELGIRPGPGATSTISTFY
jgi:hypothetical protein